MNANDTEDYPLIDQPMHVVAIYGIAYGLIFVCAIVGNIMVLAVVASTPCMHTVTNFFIANLAVADLLVAVLCIPLTFLDNIITGWPFGELMCKVTPYIQGVSVNATAYLLVAIAVDRFLAICFNYKMRILKRGAILIISIIWIASFVILSPWVVYYQIYLVSPPSHDVTQCSELWPDYRMQISFYLVVLFLATYVIPLTVISFCYALIAWRVCHRRAPGVVVGSNVIRRCKINVIKMLATVVLMFALSWLPMHAIYMRLHFNPVKMDDVSIVFIPIAQWLGLSNSGMNAFIYSFFSQNFRRGFVRLWNCPLLKRKPQRGSLSERPVTRTVSDESSSLAKFSTITRSKAMDVKNSGYARGYYLGRPLTILKSQPNVSISSSGSSGREQTFL